MHFDMKRDRIINAPRDDNECPVWWKSGYTHVNYWGDKNYLASRRYIGYPDVHPSADSIDELVSVMTEVH